MPTWARVSAATRCGDDDALLAIVTSANVACGFHAGDPEIMAHTYQGGEGERRGGRRPLRASPTSGASGGGRSRSRAGEIERLVAYQIGAAQALASYAGHRITHVNAHGTLGNLSETDKDVADAVARAIARGRPRTSAALAIARSEQVRAAERAGLRVFAQIYADRAYTEAGTLVPRSQPGAVIHDAEQAAARVVAMLEAGALITVSGAKLKTPINSVCVHGDTPDAVAAAQTVREKLKARGRDRRAVRTGLRRAAGGSNAEPIFLDAGEAALVVEFGRTIEPDDPQPRARARRGAVESARCRACVELVPTIRSLMIHYDPLVIDRAALVDAVRGIETGAAETKPARRWTIPCCYDPQFGEDIATIAEQLGMTPERVVALHSRRDVSAPTCTASCPASAISAGCRRS